MSNQACLLGLTHRLLSRKLWQTTCTIAANNHFSFRIFFLFHQDVDQFPCRTEEGSPCFDLSHILHLGFDERWRQAVNPPFPGNKTDGEKGCLLKIGTVPSRRKNVYFGSYKWLVLWWNGLGKVPRIWLAMPICERIKMEFKTESKFTCFCHATQRVTH